MWLFLVTHKYAFWKLCTMHSGDKYNILTLWDVYIGTVVRMKHGPTIIIGNKSMVPNRLKLLMTASH